MKITLIIISLIFLSGCYTIPTDKQKILARETLVLSVMMKDYQQTINIAKNPDDYYEKNKVLGRHPSTKDVKIYFASCALIHAGIAYMLPEEYSKYWQSWQLLNNLKAAINNDKNGLDSKTEFEFYIEKKWKF